MFGATGTGKSFLTRIVLAGLIHYNKASVLVFERSPELARAAAILIRGFGAAKVREVSKFDDACAYAGAEQLRRNVFNAPAVKK